ncbi:2-hydroxyacid dehydrogenase [Planctomycetota bacterium]|nr:2-hydroxyacid dehydrogenase [Planctomycetota bacterium]
MPTTIALLGERPDVIEQVYSADRLDALARRATWHPVALASRDLVPGSPGLDRIDALFATWGLARLDDRQLDALPRLRAVFYAASSVKQFAEPMLRRGIRVVSAWSANAFPVAEFALAQVLLALKGYFACAAWVRAGSGGPRPLVRGTFEATIALLGYGQVARHLRRLLRSHDLSVLVVDPYLDAATAASEQVELVSMAEAFARADVVSNHLPSLPATADAVDGTLLRRLRPGATFINTGRGSTVVETDLLAVCRERSDLTILLDVHRGPALDPALRACPNIHATPHIAGSIGTECLRLVDLLTEEFSAWLDGRNLRHEVTLGDLERLA